MLPPWSSIVAGLKPLAHEFLKDRADCRLAQERLLRDMLALNASCSAGKRHAFALMKSYGDFCGEVPVTQYDTSAGEILGMINGEKTLCCENVLFVAQTSGSSAPAKLIPFTAEKLLNFQKALHPWLLDIVNNWPAVSTGKMYWSISPAQCRAGNNIKADLLGSGDDSVYFGDTLAEPIAAVMLGSRELSRLSNFDEWRSQTLAALLGANDLTMISIWSPTFLLELLAYLKKNTGKVLSRLTDWPARRADVLREYAAGASAEFPAAEIWPSLQLISCWADASSRHFIPQLKSIFPAIAIQAKGLLATEGAVTIPWCAAGGSVLSPSSCFVEFGAEDGKYRLCDELSVGENYRIVITAHGGLYRYDIGDYVRVTGYYKSLPILEFLGRGSLISDLCGEKLSEAFAAACLEAVPGFAMLAPVKEGHLRYALIVDAVRVAARDLPHVVAAVEEKLQHNPQYRYARQLGQLEALAGQRVGEPVKRYESLCLSAGKNLGSLKFLSLTNDLNLAREFLQ